jgi:Methyltransferase domain
LPIPTFYGDEICRVNGLRYAWNILRATIKARLCGIQLFYDRRFDVDPRPGAHSDKLGFASSQSFAVKACIPGRSVLQLGIGQGNVAAELEKKLCHVTAIDFAASEISEQRPGQPFASRPSVPADVSRYHQILLMDLIEHVHDPEGFMDELRRKSMGRRPEVIVTAANVAFFVTRMMLALGQFNYSRKGILGIGHRRLFTFKSLHNLLRQSGYEIIEQRGTPAPFPLALGRNMWGRLLLRINQLLLLFSKRLFAYQIFIRARPLPDAARLLKQTISSSSALRAQVLDRVA